MMELLRISAVSYLNTFPFVYGIRESGDLNNYRLDLDVPSICAEKLINDQVDISLVPAGALTDLDEYHIVAPYCIGAVKEVKTVLLLSKVPLEKISRIYLDFDSLTSVRLVRVLANHYWKISPSFVPLEAGHLAGGEQPESVVAIGDKTFGMRQYYPYIYDLASEWIAYTALPFVFAIWISKRELPAEITEPLVRALEYGISHKSESLDYFSDRLPDCGDCLGYLEENISYHFDEQKKQGLAKFLKFLR
ncbi:MAG: menaquinone biosynthesis protein [bacterium]